MKVVLTYRVLQHWRTPVFRRLARWPGIEFCALHGGDFPGTKVVNGKDLTGFDHRELATLRVAFRSGGQDTAWPICPTLPFHLLRERPDVVLAEGGSNVLNNLFVFAYAWLTRTPVVWWTLGELRGREERSGLKRIYHRLVVAMERASSALLGYSSVALDYFRRMGYPRERQFRAVNCIDTELAAEELAAAAEEAEGLRRELGLDGKRVLLFVGALIPAKRLEDLIAAYAELRAAHPDLRLLIVGDGSHRQALETFAAEVGADDVIFTGQVVSGVGAYFEVADVFVLPGLGGLAISEAMVHGLPVIATEADGCEVDLVEQGKNGHLLPTGDRDRLVSVLDSLLREPGRIEAMSRHSSWIIENRFNIHTYMENVVAALEHAHASRSGGTQAIGHG
jgi:glycosyltransferase involved in cell wall biosynthesis